MKRSFVGINGIDHLLKMAEDVSNKSKIDPSRVKELKDSLERKHSSGEVNDDVYSKIKDELGKLDEVSGQEVEKGTFERIFGTVGSILGWAIRSGTILEDFLTAGAGIADDVVSFLAASAVESGAEALGKKVDEWVDGSSKES